MWFSGGVVFLRDLLRIPGDKHSATGVERKLKSKTKDKRWRFLRKDGHFKHRML